MPAWIRGTPGVDWPLCPGCGQGDELLIILLPDARLQLQCQACGWRDIFDDRRSAPAEYFGIGGDRRRARGNGGVH